MTIQITTDANGPQVTLGLTPTEFEDYKTLLKHVYIGALNPEQRTLLDQLTRNLNRMKFAKS